MLDFEIWNFFFVFGFSELSGYVWECDFLYAQCVGGTCMCVLCRDVEGDVQTKDKIPT